MENPLESFEGSNKSSLMHWRAQSLPLTLREAKLLLSPKSAACLSQALKDFRLPFSPQDHNTEGKKWEMIKRNNWKSGVFWIPLRATKQKRDFGEDYNELPEVVQPTSFMLNDMEKVWWEQWGNHSINLLFDLTRHCHDIYRRNTQKSVTQNVLLISLQIKTWSNQNFRNNVYSPQHSLS